MKKLLLLALLIAAVHAPAQDTPPDPRGQKLLNQMVEALGGPVWVNLVYTEEVGRVASFEHGQPTGSNVLFYEYRRDPGMVRIEYSRTRDILPGSVKDVVIIWNATNGYEITYKGKKPLLEKDVAEYNRNRAHSIHTVVKDWMKRPGVIVVPEGTAMVERRIADKFTILSPDNDAVTIFTDQTTHLPLRRTYEHRNPIFKDIDQEVEEYEDYHTYEGIPTPLSITRYHNGDMNAQRFITKVTYNKETPLSMFDIEQVKKK
jgi:hypothetical protein